MRRPSLQRLPASWPFRLLVLAWICANSPQAATYAVLTWMHGARSFTHQQRLTADIVSLVTHRSAHPVVAKNAAPAPARPLPPVPEAAVLKRIELACERDVELLAGFARAGGEHAARVIVPPSRRAAPPHDPPRWV